MTFSLWLSSYAMFISLRVYISVVDAGDSVMVEKYTWLDVEEWRWTK